MTRYAKEHGITNHKIYKDDGYSGTNFKRPGFQEMLADIEAGLVSMVIVKDMSRFGRNYLEVGLYTEVRFPELGVRFIAINDGVDSDNQMENDFTPFRNIMNEWYAKDTSKKLRAVFRNITSHTLEGRYSFRRLILRSISSGLKSRPGQLPSPDRVVTLSENSTRGRSLATCAVLLHSQILHPYPRDTVSLLPFWEGTRNLFCNLKRKN